MLDALLREASITRAAQVLENTQPAVSKVLRLPLISTKRQPRL